MSMIKPNQLCWLVGPTICEEYRGKVVTTIVFHEKHSMLRMQTGTVHIESNVWEVSVNWLPWFPFGFAVRQEALRPINDPGIDVRRRTHHDEPAAA